MADEKQRESLTIRLRSVDVERIETIRKTLGIQNHTEVIRFALAQAARQACDQPAPAPALLERDYADKRIG